MPINQNFLAARATEQRRRLLVHLGFCPPLAIPFRAGRVRFLVPQVHLTERHRLELITARNAFFTGLQPLLGDVFMLLWRLHPQFLRPDGTQPNQPPHRCTAHWLARLHASLARRLLLRQVRRCDLFGAADALRARLAEAEQDAGAPATGPGHRSAAAPDWNYFDGLVDVLGRTYHYTPDQILDLPRALVHQLARNATLSGPEGECAVFAPSDSLLSAP